MSANFASTSKQRAIALAVRRTLVWAAWIGLLGAWKGPSNFALADERAPSVAPATSEAPPADDAPVAPPGASDLEEPAAPFAPKVPRSEADEERLEALAMFGAGRAHEQHGELAQALRLYQRAFRRDPSSPLVLRGVVDLAQRLGRNSEAERYATRGAALAPDDPQWLAKLAELQLQEGNPSGAAVSYDRARGLLPDKKLAAYVLLSMQSGRTHALAKEHEAAAAAYAEVVAAIDRPDEYGLDRATKGAFQGESGRVAYEGFGESFLAAGRVTEAKAAFEKAEQLFPQPARRAFREAQLALAEKDPGRAIERLQVCLDEPGAQGVEPYEYLQKALIEAGREAELLAKLEQAHDRRPGEIPLTFFLANSLRAAGDLPRAIALYEELLAARPVAEAYQALAALYRQTKDWNKLLDLLGDVVEKGRSSGLRPLGEEAIALSKDADAVAALAAAAKNRVRATPDELSFGARLAVALLSLERERFTDADEFMELALKVVSGDPGEILLGWTLGLLAAERFEECSRLLKRITDERLAPTMTRPLQFYGSWALAMQSKTDEALAMARSAAALGETSASFEGRVPWILFRGKRWPEAEQAYREFIAKFDGQRDSTETRQEVRQARLVLSNLHVLQGDIDQAVELLEQVLDEYPADINAMNDLGYLWVERGEKLRRSLAMIQEAVAGDPENSAYRDSLAWAYYRLGRFDEALVEARRAAAVDDPDGTILDHLADIHLALGQTSLALEHWTRAIAAFEKREEPDKVRQTREKIDRHPLDRQP